MDDKDTYSTLEALLSLQNLGLLPRTGWLQHGIGDCESVADHINHTCYVVLALAPRIDPPVDLHRTLALAVVHDAPEALTGDLPRGASARLAPGAKRALEADAAEAVLGPLGAEALELFREYAAQETREARVARLADKLQLGLRLLAYERAGRRGLGEFRATLRELDCREFAAAEALRAEILAALEGAP